MLDGFYLCSGIGWLIDFSIYWLLTSQFGFPVTGANYISSIPAITFVFFVSTRKTFLCRPDGLSKAAKYLIYVVYQLLLLTAVSFLAGWLHPILQESPAAPVWRPRALKFRLLSRMPLVVPVVPPE